MTEEVAQCLREMQAHLKMYQILRQKKKREINKTEASFPQKRFALGQDLLSISTCINEDVWMIASIKMNPYNLFKKIPKFLRKEDNQVKQTKLTIIT